MDAALVIELPGPVRGKGRPRAARVGPGVRMFTDAATRSYEGMLRDAGARAMAGAAPIDGPLLLKLTAVFAVPSSWSRRARAAALSGETRPTVKPDADNIMKLTDALNGIVWVDDKQIVSATLRKVYGERPMLRLEVSQIAPAVSIERQIMTILGEAA